MATAVQGAAATGGAGSLALAASYAITSSTSGGVTSEASSDDPQEPDASLIALASEPTEGLKTWETQKIDEKNNKEYHEKLISLITSINRSSLVKAIKENQNWWEWAYSHKYLKYSNEPKDSIFQNVVPFEKEIKKMSGEAITTPTRKTLDVACENAYKAEKEKFGKEGDHLIRNIGLFCVKGINFVDLSEPIPLTYEKETTFTDYTNGLVSEFSNKASLVKTKEASNKKWWEWTFKNIFKKDQKTKYQPLFQKVEKAYEEITTTVVEQPLALNQACDNGYKKTKTEISTKENQLLKEIGALCSMGNKSNLEPPTKP